MVSPRPSAIRAHADPAGVAGVVRGEVEHERRVAATFAPRPGADPAQAARPTATGGPRGWRHTGRGHTGRGHTGRGQALRARAGRARRSLEARWARLDALDRLDSVRLARAAAVLGIGLWVAWIPLIDAVVPAAVTWTLYYAVFVLGLAALLGTPRRGAAPAVALVAFWAVWFVGRPVWTSWWLVGAPVHREQRALLACALVSLGVLFLTRGTRSGARSLRALWLAVTASTGAMGVWEVVTRQHYPLAAPYAPPDFSPSGPFGNPNNFAAVLLVGFGLTVLWATERVRTRVRVGLGALAATYAVLVVLTLSRLALVAMLVLAVLPLLLRWQRHGGPTRLRQRCDRRPRAAAAATVLAGTALLAAFVVPALARVNPVLRVLFPGDDETTRADGLRRNLIEAGLRFWADDPVRGIGGGRFEILLRRQRPDIGVVTNMHNGFVELLVEYGLLLSVPLAVVLAVLLVGIVSPAGRTGRGSAGAGTPAAARTPEGDAGGGRPALARYAGAPAHLDDLGARYLIVVLLVAFGVAGVVTSSPLQWFMWWLMLASAVGLAWAHRAQISPRRPERS